jgi:hypothetical protein
VNTEEFEHWWASNHEWDWYASLNNDKPVNHKIRLAIWQLCRAAWIRDEVDKNYPWKSP